MNKKSALVVAVGLLMMVAFPFPTEAQNSTSGQSANQDLHIALFTSGHTSGFWPMVETFAIDTAADLGLKLTIHHFSDQVTMMEMVKTALTDPLNKPDGILFSNYKHRGEKVLEAAEAANVPALMFNAGPTGEDKFGRPRENFRNFIGLLTPDDEKAGYDLAMTLIGLARERGMQGRDGKIHLVALEGNITSQPALLRKKGLQQAVSEAGDVVIDQYFKSEWNREKAADAFRASTARYPDVRIFWAASDSMAFGVLDAARNANKRPGVDFVTGGIDLTSEAPATIRSGEMGVSIGGHYSEVVWALLLMYDYLKGCDFTDLPFQDIKSGMYIYTEKAGKTLPTENTAELTKWLKNYDFSRHSRCLFPENKAYSFNATTFFESP